jgi:RNA polymerase-associated protein RTF1
MEKWCHSPFFRDTVIGCFVRIGIGSNKSKQSVYIVAQIVDVTETAKTYELGKTRTNKGIKLRHARQADRVFRLEFVSNNEFSANEFNKWFESMTNDRCELPSKEFVERKKRDVMNAINYSYSDHDIESIVQEKERFNKRPVNFAMKKTRLLKEKELAEMNGDNQRVESLMQEIDDLESEAKKIDKQRTQNIAAISYINERNRMMNIKEAEKAIVEQSANNKALNNSQDPFTRRKCTPTMIHMFNKNKQLNNRENNESVVGNNDNNVKTETNNKNELNEEFKKEVLGLDLNIESLDPKSSLAIEKASSPGSGGQQNDLFSAHNFDIKIDFDVDIGIPSASSANSSLSSSFLTTHNHSSNTPKTTNRRSLNLEEYKKKKGLI